MTLVTRYELTPRIARSLERIENARALLEKHLEEPEPWHGVIRKQVMASVVHYSTKIEGNRLTREQVEAIIAGEAIEAPEKDKTEALNYYQAMRWAQTRANDPSWRLTHETLLTLHFMVGQNLGNDYEPLGRYRLGQNTVEDRTSGQIIYWPPRGSDVQELMSTYVDWLRKELDGPENPYIVNALAHLNFAGIHPFSDGNGRVARVLCSLLMMREGYKAQAFYSLEEFFGINWEAYGQEIERCLGPRWRPEDAVATSWIEWYVNAIAEQVSSAQEAMRRSIAELGVVYMGLAVDGVSPSRVAVAVWLAIRDGEVTNREYRSTLDIAARSATEDFRKLVESGHLEKRGRRRGSRYLPGPRVEKWGPFDELVELWLDDGSDAVFERLRGTSAPSLFDEE